MNGIKGLCLGAAVWCLASAVAPAQTASGPEVPLRPRWTPGDQATFEVVQRAHQKREFVEGGPPGMEKDFKQELTISRRVVSADEKGTTLELRFLRAKVDVVADGEILNADTAKPASEDDENGLGPYLRRIIDRPITVVLDRDSNVKDVSGNTSPDQDKEPFPLMTVGNPMIRDTLSALYRLPSAPPSAQVGRKWDNIDATPSPPIGTMRTTCAYTLDSAGPAEAKIGMTGTISITPAVGPAAVTSTIRVQKVEGAIVWDTRAGTLLSLDRSERLEFGLDSRVGQVPHANTSSLSIKRVAPGGDAATQVRPTPGAAAKNN